jgi:hypothetical protein
MVLTIVLVACVIAAVLISKVLGTAKKMHQRPAELREAAARLGFEFRALGEDGEEEERLLAPLVQGTLLWRRNRNRRQQTENLLTGHREGLDIFLFDLSWKAPREAPVYQSVLLLRSQQRLWPFGYIVPNAEGGDVPRVQGGRNLTRLGYAGAEKFGEDYAVFAWDEGRLRSLLGQEPVSLLTGVVDRNPFVELHEDRFLYYQQNRWVSGQDLSAFVAEGLRLAHCFSCAARTIQEFGP